MRRGIHRLVEKTKEIRFPREGSAPGDAPVNGPPPLVTVIDESQTRFLNTAMLRQLATGSHTPASTFQRLSALYEVSSAMLSLKDFGEVSEKLLDLVFANVACERAVVMLYDERIASLAPERCGARVDGQTTFSP